MKKFFKILFVFFISWNIGVPANAQERPVSFADLAEKVMPSVVNISTTTTVTTQANPFPFEFPPGSPFEDMFKEFGTPQKRKSSALGSGFIIDKEGIVITNNWKCFADIIEKSSKEQISLKSALAVSPNYILKGNRINNNSKLRVVFNACFR